MSHQPTIASLFSDAAKFLRAHFERVRVSQPHAGTKGEEVENILRDFLNDHLPRRFRAGSGIIIDEANELSPQTDIVIYDALSSPLYLVSEVAQIVPANSVASVIEVKSSLDKRELRDGYEKIAAVKVLKKRPLSEVDRPATGSPLRTLATLGVIFAFDSAISTDALVDHVAELNQDFSSNLWPDMMVVLDKLVVTYALAYPGADKFAGTLAPPTTDDFVVPPFYVHPVIFEEAEFTLNRFFLNLLSHLTFYPYRIGTPTFDIMLRGSKMQAMTVAAYRYGLDRKLHPVPASLYSEHAPEADLLINVYNKAGNQIGRMEYLAWEGGAVIRWLGPIPLARLLGILLPRREHEGHVVIRQPDSPGFELSSVLPIDEGTFRSWPKVITQRAKLRAVLETKEKSPST